MPFIHPAIFITGMVAASIPIIIHLLNRRRFKIRDWAAMKFLLESVRKNRRRVRIEEIILLVLRTLVLVLLALAISRFTGCGETPLGITQKGASTTVFILDDSASMGQKLGSGTMFAGAAADLIEQVRKLPQGDQMGLLLTSRSEPFVDRSIIDKNLIESVVGRLQALRASDTRCTLGDPAEKGGALAAAREMLEKDTAPNKQVVVIGDFRKIDLQREQIEQIRKQFTALREKGVRVTVMDYGRDCRNNLTADKIELVDKFAVNRAPIHVRLTVRNNGATTAQGVPVRIKIKYLSGGQFSEVSSPEQTIKEIPARDTAYLDFTVNSPGAGPMVVTAELPPDDLPGDNVASLALDVRPALRVLVIDGNYDVTNPLADESFFFTTAIDPDANGSYGNKADVITPDDIEKVTLDDYDLVVMMNVNAFPATGLLDQPAASAPATQEGQAAAEAYPGLAALERFVSNGGGLAVFTGDKINLDFYGATDADASHGRFYNNGHGLLPAPLGAPVVARDGYFRFDQGTFEADALLRTFQEFKRSNVDVAGLIRVSAFSPLIDTAGATPYRVLARFNDPRHSPAIVARQYDKGTVVVFLTTGSKRWTDWPIDEVGTFAATVNDMLMYLARPARADLTAPVGEPIIYELPIRYRDARATLKVPPEMDETTLEPSKEQKGLVKFAQPRNAGVYWLTLDIPKDRRDILLARNIDCAEGQLAPGNRPDITNAFGGNEKDFTYIDRTGAANAAAVTAGPEKEYWMMAIAAMLVLLAAETFLGQRFGHYNG